MAFIENKGLEIELRKEWEIWNNKAHQEDMMSFLDFVDEVDSFNGHTVKVEDGFGMDMKIKFEM